MDGLAGKVALVTGGGAGIGRAIALKLAREGSDIAVLDIDGATAEKSAEAVRKLGRRAAAIAANVTDRGTVDAAIARATAALGPIDILVNNAGIARLGPLLDMPEQDWHDTFAVNVDGVFHVSRAVVPAMVARKTGAVVNLASWLGKRGQPSIGAYAASKFAVIGFTQSLACEVAAHGVRVNAVSPGLIVDTPMRTIIDEAAGRAGLPQAKERAKGIPLGRAGVPEDVARVVAFLASDEAGYVTGATYDITGGLWMS